MIGDLESRMARIETKVDGLSNLLTVYKESHAGHHHLQDVALEKALAVLETRLHNLNELRQEYTEHRSSFVTEAVAQERNQRLLDRLSEVQSFQDNLQGKIWALNVVFGVAITILNLILGYVMKKG